MCSFWAFASSFNFEHASLTCIQADSIASRSSSVGFHLDDSMHVIIKDIELVKLNEKQTWNIRWDHVFILERVKFDVDTDNYLEHVVDYCKKDYQQAYKNKKGIELSIDEIQPEYDNQRKKWLVIFNFLNPIRNKSLFLLGWII